MIQKVVTPFCRKTKIMVNKDFEQQLHKAFNGRFRLRWSDKLQEYHLEQRVGVARDLMPPIDEEGIYDTYNDDWIRARDGYFKIMTVRAGDRMPCPRCGFDVNIPVMETAQVSCPYCSYGKDDPKRQRWVAAYFPLNHTLIEYIKEIDPENDGPERARLRAKDRRENRIARLRKEALDEADYGVIHNENQAFQKPMTGYGPKTAQRGDATRFE